MHSAVHVFHRNAQRLGFFAVNVSQQLPRKRIECAGHAANFRPLLSLGFEATHHLGQLADGGVPLALNPQFHTAGSSQTRNRGRIDWQDDAFLHLGECFGRCLDHGRGALGCDGFRILVTFFKILEADEESARIVLVLTVQQAVAVNDGHALDSFVVHEVVTGDLANLTGAIQAGRVRHDHRAE